MPVKLADIEDRLPQTGLGRAELLDFVRTIPTSDVMVLRQKVQDWVNECRSVHGLHIKEDDVSRVLGDLATDRRITHETIIGSVPRQRVGLRRKQRSR